IADRLLPSDLNLPRESSMSLMRDLVLSGRLPVDPTRNDFPVTLHDPCNITRLMGITEAQRDVLRAVCPDIREMTPNRTDNYCCGGGSGFALMSGKNFIDWRLEIAGAKKMEQVLAAFAGCMDPSIPKYICAPCSNCKGQFRRLLRWLIAGVLLGWSLLALTLLSLRWIDPPFTAVHIERRVQAWMHKKAYRKRYGFVALDRISSDFQHAVVAAEDARFFQHHGFDWHEIQVAVEDHLEEGHGLGASTITQQLVKNLFFGTGRSF